MSWKCRQRISRNFRGNLHCNQIPSWRKHTVRLRPTEMLCLMVILHLVRLLLNDCFVFA